VSAKRLFILANSIKKRHRCVAGREITTDAEGRSSWGKWIRPVSTHDEGAITKNECRLDDNCIPKLFDVIEIPFMQYENDPTQPENWIIQKDSTWNKITKKSLQEAIDLVESPENLWLQTSVKQDRVTSDYLLSLENHQSLYLIKPENFRFLIETKPWNGKRRVRGLFKYNGVSYNFSLTDPEIGRKYFPNFSNIPDDIINLEDQDNCLLCVSLTPEFQGYNYKIVATVIEC